MKMVEQISEVDTVISSLNEIKDDISVPRNVRIKIETIIGTLKEDLELLIKINKALNELDGISTDVNLHAYTRTQVWNIMSVLEKLVIK